MKSGIWPDMPAQLQKHCVTLVQRAGVKVVDFYLIILYN
jgi:hypothetical protein